MKTARIFIALCVLPAFVAACSGKSNDNPIDNVKAASADPDLQSKAWRSECSLNPIKAIISGIVTGGENAVKSSIEMYEFVGANLTHSTHVFQSADCTGTEAIVFKETGSFKILDDQKTTDGGKFIDIEYDKLSLQTLDAVGAQIANNLKMCGLTNWMPSQEEREVSSQAKDLNCYGVALPRRVLDVYRIDNGNTVYFGEKKDRVMKDRPTSLDTGAPYRSN